MNSASPDRDKADRIDPITGVKLSEYDEEETPVGSSNDDHPLEKQHPSLSSLKHAMEKTGFPQMASRAIDNPRLALSWFARTAALFAILYWYCEKFLRLSITNILVLSDEVESPLNPEDYQLSTMILVLGGLTLFSFLLAANEHRHIFRELVSRPISMFRNDGKPMDSDLLAISNSIFAITMFALSFSVIPLLGFYIPEQTPILFIGAGICSAVILYQGAVPELLRSPAAIYGSRDDRWQLGKNVLSAVYFALPIILVLYLPTNLAAWPQIESKPTEFFSLLISIIAVIWISNLGRAKVSPKMQDRHTSSIGILLLLPFFTYIATQVMFLLNHPNEVTMERWNLEFEFMSDPNPFDITAWPWDVRDNVDDRWEFWKAAVINSARVTLMSIVLCTILGTIVGVTRLSSNKLAASLATAYVEVFRNLPLAVLLFLVSLQLGESLPLKLEVANIRETVYYSNQGIYTPAAEASRIAYALLLLVAIRVFLYVKDRKGFDDSEEGIRRRFTVWTLGIAAAAGIVLSGDFAYPIHVKDGPLNIWVGSIEFVARPGIPGSWDIYGGSGFKITAEFLAMLLGLTLFTAAVVAEIVRGSIQSLPRGQVEASISLGLNPFQRLRLVILPQALRSMVPLLNSQYMNVWKNSSLAMIVAYADIYYVINVYLNNVGKLIPLFIILLLTYQAGSLLISLLMNAYNSRVTKVKI
ncbi:MAG: hypothetical protein CMA59_02925 [Euryarchaeota archaeon]|nr:hypothetical protein [Euryarchaeota archaeon]